MENNFLKIENHNDLVRDPSTNAIINKNETEYQNYLRNYERLRREKEELHNLKDDVESLKSDIGDIKNLLTKLIEVKQHDD
jgi:hypothetical protein